MKDLYMLIVCDVISELPGLQLQGTELVIVNSDVIVKTSRTFTIITNKIRGSASHYGYRLTEKDIFEIYLSLQHFLQWQTIDD